MKPITLALVRVRVRVGVRVRVSVRVRLRVRVRVIVRRLRLRRPLLHEARRHRAPPNTAPRRLHLVSGAPARGPPLLRRLLPRAPLTQIAPKVAPANPPRGALPGFLCLCALARLLQRDPVELVLLLDHVLHALDQLVRRVAHLRDAGEI